MGLTAWISRPVALLIARAATSSDVNAACIRESAASFQSSIRKQVPGIGARFRAYVVQGGGSGRPQADSEEVAQVLRAQLKDSLVAYWCQLCELSGVREIIDREKLNSSGVPTADNIGRAVDDAFRETSCVSWAELRDLVLS